MDLEKIKINITCNFLMMKSDWKPVETSTSEKSERKICEHTTYAYIRAFQL